MTFEVIKQHWVIISISIILIYLIYRRVNIFEGLDNSAPQTIFAVGNAFTGLECVDDSMPLYSQDTNTFMAISKDGTNPLYRKDLNIPNNIECRDTYIKLFTPWQKGYSYQLNDNLSYGNKNYTINSAHVSGNSSPDFTKLQATQNINTFLAKDGIRQLPLLPTDVNYPNSRNTFDALSKDGYTTIKCEYKALNTDGHWCKRIHESYQTWCSKLDKFTRSSHTECDSLVKYYNKQSVLGDSSGVTSTLYKNLTEQQKSSNAALGIIDAATLSTCQNKNCIRNKPQGMSSSDCKANCSKCGATKC
jgi:hypothetical protein